MTFATTDMDDFIQSFDSTKSIPQYHNREEYLAAMSVDELLTGNKFLDQVRHNLCAPFVYRYSITISRIFLISRFPSKILKK